MIHYFLKRNVKNCLICAIKPLIYAGFTITYIGKAKCPHTNKTRSPRIEENITSTSLALVCNLFLLTDILYVIFKLYNSEHLSIPPKYYYDIILPNFINTLNYTFCLLRGNSSHIKHINGLITLIDKRKFFGVDSVLTKRFTQFLQLWSTLWFVIMFAVNLLLVSTTTPAELSVESVLLAISMSINNANAISFALYIMTILMIYKALFRACYDGIYKALKEPSQRQVLATISFQERLQFLQQFYIAICSNYKHILGFGTILFYTGQFVFTVVSVVQAYFSTFKTIDAEGYWIMFFSKFFYSFLTLATFVSCLQIHSVQFMGQDLISFLYKYKISEISSTEASQVEMLLITLETERPTLTASNLYNIGVTLLSSISGTSVTYVLVALQFHTTFSMSNSSN